MSQPEIITEKTEASRPRARLRSVGNAAVNLAIEHSRKAEAIALRRIMRTQGFETRLLTDETAVQEALALEQAVWHEKDFGDLKEYEKYLPQSRIFAAFDKEGRVVGMNRLFAGAPEVPPFASTDVEPDKILPFYDESLREDLIELGRELQVEEFGTVAVTKELRGSRAFLDICRAAWRDASDRGIQAWGIIMEPERVEKMNQGLSFTFKQIGPAVDYQGGDCAAHIMDFDEVRANMSAAKPELYDWFVNQPLDQHTL